jgi:phosphate transport system permease protein
LNQRETIIEPSGRATGGMPIGQGLRRNIRVRRQRGTLYRTLLLSSVVLALAVLAVLLFDIVNTSVGYVAVQNRVEPEQLTGGRPLQELEKDELVVILQENVSAGVFRRLERDQPFGQRPQENVLALVRERVVREETVSTWSLAQSLFDRAAIEAQVAEEFPGARVQWRSWINREFLLTPMASEPAFAGVRTAILGSLWMILITILVAFPIGVGAAIYLEEYAGRGRINRMIQTNINNLAGVPSIIYGMLGLAIFVRALEPFTSGSLFGVTSSNGRTILAASLTMALLILPLLIINGQEAIRAVPLSLRQASYALGATKWQTTWHHVLPMAFPGILTGTILATSRAIGETAPLIVIGASTFIVSDPDGPFSKFTALPIQIYNWTQQPQEQFRIVAAAAIIVLLVMLLTLNSVAVLLRNRFKRSM